MAAYGDTPANASEKLAGYETIWHQSLQMLEAARQGDWERLITLEHARATISSALMEQQRGSNFTQANQERMRELIRAILASDEEIRMLVAPRQDELRNLVGSLNTEKKLLMAYAVNT